MKLIFKHNLLTSFAILLHTLSMRRVVTAQISLAESFRYSCGRKRPSPRQSPDGMLLTPSGISQIRHYCCILRTAASCPDQWQPGAQLAVGLLTLTGCSPGTRAAIPSQVWWPDKSITQGVEAAAFRLNLAKKSSLLLVVHHKYFPVSIQAKGYWICMTLSTCSYDWSSQFVSAKSKCLLHVQLVIGQAPADSRLKSFSKLKFFIILFKMQSTNMLLNKLDSSGISFNVILMWATSHIKLFKQCYSWASLQLIVSAIPNPLSAFPPLSLQ